jgi:hypothetical protein
MPRKQPFRNEKGRTRKPCLDIAYAGPLAFYFFRNETYVRTNIY